MAYRPHRDETDSLYLNDVAQNTKSSWNEDPTLEAGGPTSFDVYDGSGPHMFASDESDLEKGGTWGDDLPGDWMSPEAQERRARLGFIRKVYGILSFQLLLTIGVACLFLFVNPLKHFVQDTPAMFWVAIFLPFIFLFALFAKKNNYPANMILLALFTASEAYLLAIVCSFYDAKAVLEAVILTAIVVVTLTAYTFQSKRDFSFLGAGLYAALMILIFGGLIHLFLPFGPVLNMVWSIAGATVFSLFIIYDTSRLLHQLSPDDYILGAIELYLDIINLFIYILAIVGGRRD